MANPKWGDKHRCSSCTKPFYDMKKKPIICPVCGAENVPERLLKPRRNAGPSAAEKKAIAAAAAKRKEELTKPTKDDTDLIDPDTVDMPNDDEEEDDLSGVVIAPKGDDES
ncbi:MAG: TIGR02300 family protein [Sneathiella sp.]|uniref:TIGR02300 family protein n=1 Tax=Sneathiella sp. TaxID=1964365 RepID=UPI00300388BB